MEAATNYQFELAAKKTSVIDRCVHVRLPAHRKFHRTKINSNNLNNSRFIDFCFIFKKHLIHLCRSSPYSSPSLPTFFLSIVCLLLLLIPICTAASLVGDQNDQQQEDYFLSSTNNNFNFNEEEIPKLLIGRKLYTNQWAIRLDNMPEGDVDRFAAKYGYINNGRIFSNYYSFTMPSLRKRSVRNARHLRHELASDPQVLWIEQQVAKRRVKRDFVLSDCTDFSNPQCRSSRTFQSYNYDPNDPEWINMWYLNRRSLNFDHNVKEAWALGVTGKDVVVTILDDGLEIKHPDIEKNYDPQASYDINQNDADPTPRYDLTNENRHGTRCAGEVAAEFNNSMCIVGVAFQSSIGGIKMLDGEVTDIVEAQSLSHNRQHVHIYSASWGPDDDGKTVDGPAKLASLAFKEGVEQGRGGKGSIFVWASGNGGRDADNCNCDGYTNSIYTLSISSATENGNVPWYSEACSSTMATTYSSGSHGERMIVTTDLHFGCTNGHTGTSASAPLAAGICALALHANPNLTWRDLQHIVVRTAKPDNLRAQDWVTNGVGRNVSHSFGYGLMDAGAMVRLARNWTTVPRQKKCSVVPSSMSNGATLEIQSKEIRQSKVYTEVCSRDPETSVVYLEHVQARVTLSLSSTAKRGDIQIFLTSPKGTRSTLLAKRARDTSKIGFRDWAFMSTHNWGENGVGDWTLEIQNDAWGAATLHRWELVIYGTSEVVGPYGGSGASGISPGFSTATVPRCCSWSPLNLCAGCLDGYALYQNQCVKECPSQYYLHVANVYADKCASSSCRLCASFCQRCSGPEPSACLECIRGFTLVNDKCVKKDDGRSGYRSVYDGGFVDDDDPARAGSSSSSFVIHHYEYIVAGVVAVVIVLSLGLVALWYVRKRQKRQAELAGSLAASRADRRAGEKNCLKIFCNNWILSKLRRRKSESATSAGGERENYDNNRTPDLNIPPVPLPQTAAVGASGHVYVARQPWSTVRAYPDVHHGGHASGYNEACL